MLATLRRLWGRLPESIRQAMVATGVPYAASFISRYAEKHRIVNFAGTLEQLTEDYRRSSTEKRVRLSEQFASVVDALIMPNAVKKTTYENRLARSLETVLSSVQLPRPDIRILDLPSSTGVASLKLFEILAARYRVVSYVLGDKYHEILYDSHRGCVFDSQGHLLQVAYRKYFFSIYRGHISGNEHTFLSACLLFPHTVIASYLRKRHCFKLDPTYRRLLLIHPDVERHLGEGTFRLLEADVFQPIPGCYDLVLSFNLLQRNYFPPDIVQAGVNNLAATLSEGGVLVMGNSEAFVALQKQGGALIPRIREGTF